MQNSLYGMNLFFRMSIIFMFVSLNSFSQNQWKFYIAFEDAVSQKDTLWMIYDSSATFGMDTALGEGSSIVNPASFNVWMFNNNFDSTKTNALPYSNFPVHGLYNIYAFNYTYPILITWDTSLFHSPLLPIQTNNYINIAKIDNDYYFGINNDPGLQAYNMLFADSAVAP